MKKTILILLLGLFVCTIHAVAQDTNYATRVDCELQTAGPEKPELKALHWTQGQAPLMEFRPLRSGRQIVVSSNTSVRMVFASSPTNTPFAVATNYLAAGTNDAHSFWIQWGAIGTNTCPTNSDTADAWWYTVYFTDTVGGQDYWSGNGDLYIEKSTSLNNGLDWLNPTSLNTVVWASILGSPTNSAALMALIESYAGADTEARAGVASNTAAINGLTNADFIVRRDDIGWREIGAQTSGGGDPAFNGFAYLRAQRQSSSPAGSYLYLGTAASTGIVGYVYSGGQWFWDFNSGVLTNLDISGVESDPFSISNVVWYAGSSNYFDPATKTFYLTNLPTGGGGGTAIKTNAAVAVTLLSDGTTNLITRGTNSTYYLNLTGAVNYIEFDSEFDETVTSDIVIELRGTNSLTMLQHSGTPITTWTDWVTLSATNTVRTLWQKPTGETNWTGVGI